MKPAWPVLLSVTLGSLLMSGFGISASSSDKDEADLKAGATVYRKICIACHTPKGKSPIEDLNLADDNWKHGTSPEELEKVVSEGIPDTAMVGFSDNLSPDEIRAVIKYIHTFGKNGEQ